MVSIMFNRLLSDKKFFHQMQLQFGEGHFIFTSLPADIEIVLKYFKLFRVG